MLVRHDIHLRPVRLHLWRRHRRAANPPGRHLPRTIGAGDGLRAVQVSCPYITGVEVNGPVKLGTQYKIETTSMGHKNTTTNEVVAFEPDKKFGVKTFASPPASDVTNTYILEQDGAGTKLTLQLDAVLLPAGMPNVPGMEDMMKEQMLAGIRATLDAMKKLIEGS